MKPLREGDGLALATLAWALFWCADVAVAWVHSPYDRWGWVAAAGLSGAALAWWEGRRA